MEYIVTISIDDESTRELILSADVFKASLVSSTSILVVCGAHIGDYGTQRNGYWVSYVLPKRRL